MNEEDILKELEKVVDPEIGVPITQMDLVDDIKIKDNEVKVDFHLTMPYCPEVFAIQIAQDIKKRILSLEGVEKVKVTLKDHVKAEEINKIVAESNPDS